MRKVRIVIRGFAAYYVGVALFERLAPRSVVRAYQRVNNRLMLPVLGWLPGWGVVETVGRRTGLRRQVPVGGRLTKGTFWLVAGDGRHSAFVKNLEANPRVRVRTRGRWHDGTARVVVDDNPRLRLLRTNPLNGLFVGLANPRRDMLTVRVDLDRAAEAGMSGPAGS